MELTSVEHYNQNSILVFQVVAKADQKNCDWEKNMPVLAGCLVLNFRRDEKKEQKIIPSVCRLLLSSDLLIQSEQVQISVNH